MAVGPSRRGNPGQTYQQTDPTAFVPENHQVIQTYGTGGSTAAAAKGYVSDAYNWAAGNPKGQKEAYDTAAQGYQDLGNSVSSQYAGLGRGIQADFNDTQNDLNAQRDNRPGQQQEYFDFAKYNTTKPTNDENYLDYYKGVVGKDTNQETLLKNDTYGNSPTDVEQLYAARKGGYDPAAAYEDNRATELINNQMAARGGYNSGAAGRQIVDYYGNVGAQRSHQLADLAGASSGAANSRANYRSGLASGADTSRFNVNNAYGDASNAADTSRLNVNKEAGDAAAGASREQSDYYNSVSDNSMKLASARAGIDSDLGSKAIEAYKNGQVASIQAYLSKAGVDAKAIAAFTESLKTVVEASSK